jgi:hypothetical protein
MSPDEIRDHRGGVRALLVLLGLPQAALGLWALLAPHSFYGDFPGGVASHWVSRLGPYDEHLVRDVGGVFLGLGVLLVIAAVYLERRLVIAAGVAWLLFSIPHLVYHVFNLEPYSTADAIGNVVALVWTVAGGLAVLVLAVRRSPQVAGAAAGAATDAAGQAGANGGSRADAITPTATPPAA